MMQMRGSDGGDSTKTTKTNAQHNSATTYTHKDQRLHTAAGANSVGDGTPAVGADDIGAL